MPISRRSARREISNVLRWLDEPPDGSVDFPVTTRPQTLPFQQLMWENFEKLCGRLARQNGEIERCQPYGTPGQRQHGIDLFVRRGPKQYAVYQCRQVKRFRSAAVRKAVRDFQAGQWAATAEEFIICTTSLASDTSAAEEIERQTELLRLLGVKLTIWDAGELATRLKRQYDLVEGFFSRPWADAFCEGTRRQPRSRPLSGTTAAWKREDLVAYLAALDRRLRILPHFFPAHLSFETAVMPLKVTRTRRSYPAATHFHDSELDSESLDRSIYYRRYGEHHSYLVCDAPETWASLCDTSRRCIVLGDPGFGKTWLLRHAVLRQAHTLLDRVNSGVHDRSGAHLPLFIRLNAYADYVVQRRDKDKSSPLTILSDYVAREYRLPTSCARWFSDHAGDSSVLVALDGLDEVSAQSRSALGDNLQWLADNTGWRMLVTSRLAGYQRPFSLDKDDTGEVELLGLESDQVEPFIHQWLSADPRKAAALVKTLALQPTLKAAVHIPLFLSFICALAEYKSTMPAARVDFLEGILRLLLEQPWKLHPLPGTDACDIEERLSVLEDIAWRLATQQSWRDIVPRGEVLTCIRDHLREVDQKTSPAMLLTQLSVRDGVVVPVGVSPSTSATPLAFIHRTLHEYLVASRLARLPTRERLALLRSVWHEPAWQEAIVLHAAMNTEIDTFLSTLAIEPIAPFNDLVLLAGRCIAECQGQASRQHRVRVIESLRQLLASRSRLDRSRASQVLALLAQSHFDDVLGLIGPHAEDPRWWVRSAVALCFRAVDARRVIPLLFRLLDDPHDAVQDAAVHAFQDTRGPEVLDELLRLFSSSPMRRLVITAFRGCFDERVVRLLSAHATTAEPEERLAIVNTLAWPRNPAAAEMFLTFLRVQDSRIRLEAVRVLRSLEDERLLAAIPELLQDPSVASDAREALWVFTQRHGTAILSSFFSSDDPVLRSAAARALEGSPDDPDVQAVFRAAKHWTNLDARMDAIQAVGGTSIPETIDTLVDLLSDPDSDTRATASYALRQCTARYARQRLESLLKKRKRDTKIEALDALHTKWMPELADYLVAMMRSRDHGLRDVAIRRCRGVNAVHVVDECVRLAQSTDALVAATACKALQSVTNSRATTALISQLRHDDWYVREAAVESLFDNLDHGVPFAVLPLLGDPLSRVREAAVATLANLCHSNGQRCLDVSNAILENWTSLDTTSAYGLLFRIVPEVYKQPGFEPFSFRLALTRATAAMVLDNGSGNDVSEF